MKFEQGWHVLRGVTGRRRILGHKRAWGAPGGFGLCQSSRSVRGTSRAGAEAAISQPAMASRRMTLGGQRCSGGSHHRPAAIAQHEQIRQNRNTDSHAVAKSDIKRHPQQAARQGAVKEGEQCGIGAQGIAEEAVSAAAFDAAPLRKKKKKRKKEKKRKGSL